MLSNQKGLVFLAMVFAIVAAVSIMIYCGLTFCPVHSRQVGRITDRRIALYYAEAGIQRARERIVQDGNPSDENFIFPDPTGTQIIDIDWDGSVNPWHVTATATYIGETVSLQADIEFNAGTGDHDITFWDYM